VAVTGIGLVTALGIGTEATWRALVDGRSGVGPVTRFDASSLRSQLAAEQPGFDAKAFVTNRKSLRIMTRGDQLGYAAAALALRDAAWEPDSTAGSRVAVYAGSNKEMPDPEHFRDALLASLDEDRRADVRRFGTAAFESVYPLFYVEGLPGSLLFFISEAYGFTGSNAYFAGTAESSAVAIGTAFRAIRRGEADVALAGGFDDPVSWWNFTKLDALEILTDRNDLASAACRPFDRDRTGSVLGEGAAFLLLEELEIARRRGARVYAELVGFGSAFAAAGFMTPDEDGVEVAAAVEAALREAGSPGDRFGYVAGHGSGTVRGDLSESRGIRSALGSHADTIVGSSIKPATGHLVGAAGALNAAVAALAVDAGVVPPTLNLESPDRGCLLDWVPRESRAVDLNGALAIARGLEGQAVALALGSARR